MRVVRVNVELALADGKVRIRIAGSWAGKAEGRFK